MSEQVKMQDIAYWQWERNRDKDKDKGEWARKKPI